MPFHIHLGGNRAEIFQDGETALADHAFLLDGSAGGPTATTPTSPQSKVQRLPAEAVTLPLIGTSLVDCSRRMLAFWKLRPMAVSWSELKLLPSIRRPVSMPRRMSRGSSRGPSSKP
ncbi:MAG TPA: hypothetical protein PKB04_09520, partial [Phenylobacterium sp.]|nr:hypothetical protein [Phenylobacterium sp.]